MLPTPLACHPDTRLLTAAALLLAVAFAGGLVMPVLFWAALAAAVMASIGFLAYRHPTGFCVAWLLVTGMTLEMTLYDLSPLSRIRPPRNRFSPEWLRVNH
ncbi:MAG: hypothetical protein ACJ8AW_54505 [Rhodopila sp.]